ncbi:MAG TPA: hypothetical protein VNJ46_06875 [Gaiellaceae bacterium]|nr:hypothetical protein [Gaiellaceae bacterium]
MAAPPSEPLRAGTALKRAARDFYEESWRLVLLNSALSAYVLTVLALGAVAPPALLLLLGAGPLAAALVSAAVTVVETGSLTFLETAAGLRRCFGRGLLLGAAVAVFALATVVAVRFYGGAGTLAWPLAVLVLYLAGIFALYQLLLWPLALRDCARPLREAAAEAGIALVRRPLGTLGLGVALLAVNLAGLALAVLPFLTMTVAYSALAAARFALPPPQLEEA